MAFCTKCGTQLDAGAAFCGHCGAAIAAATSPAATSPAATSPAATSPAIPSPGRQSSWAVYNPRKLAVSTTRRKALTGFVGSALFAFFGVWLIFNPEFLSNHPLPIFAALVPEVDQPAALMIFGFVILLLFGFLAVVWAMVVARQIFAPSSFAAEPKDHELPPSMPLAPTYPDSGSQKSEASQDSSLFLNAPKTNTTISSFERFATSCKTGALVIALALVGVGIHYSYTQHHRQALISTVRGAHVPEFPNLTIGQALEGNFQNYEWTTFKNPDKSITVGFVGYETFKSAMGPGNQDMTSCIKRHSTCFPILKKISDACSTFSGFEEEEASCVRVGLANNANTLIPVHFQFAVNDQDGSVSLIKTDIVSD